MRSVNGEDEMKWVAWVFFGSLLLVPRLGAANQTPGLVPLDELATTYQGFEGGLYPGGASQPVGDHAGYGDTKTAEVVPRLTDGTPDDGGFIGVVSIGMSNTNQKWSRFERDADAAREHWGRVVLVDGAQGGVDAESMAPADSMFWGLLDARIDAGPLTPEQIQVVWLMNSIRGEQGTFPGDIQQLARWYGQIIDNARSRFPNLAVVYLGSRAYAGSVNREPYGFETAFAAKWTIQTQTDAIAAGAADGPFLAWGPYFWTNGDCPRQSDGLIWLPEDHEDDGANVHPSRSGETKAARLLSEFFSSDVRASSWYARTDGVSIVVLDAIADGAIEQGAGQVDAISHELSGAGGAAYVKFDLTSVGAPVALAKLSLLADEFVAIRDLEVARADGDDWDEATLLDAPPLPGVVLANIPTYARGGAASADVTAAVNDAIAADLPSISFVLRGQGTFMARESLDPPRLVMTVAAGSLPGEDMGADPDVGVPDMGLDLGPDQPDADGSGDDADTATDAEDAGQNVPHSSSDQADSGCCSTLSRHTSSRGLYGFLLLMVTAIMRRRVPKI